MQWLQQEIHTHENVLVTVITMKSSLAKWKLYSLSKYT